MKGIEPSKKLYTAIAWLVIIWIFSSIPSKSIPSVKIIGIDKLVHFGEYLVLASLTNRWLKARNSNAKDIALTYALMLVGATIDELHQTFVPNRSVSGWDLLANATGILLGFGLQILKHDKSK